MVVIFFSVLYIERTPTQKFFSPTFIITQKLKFSVKNVLNKCYQNRIWKRTEQTAEVFLEKFLKSQNSYFVENFSPVATIFLDLENQKQSPEVYDKKDILKISQNSRENTCAGISFLIKLQVLGLQHYKNWGFNTRVFL